MQPKLHTSTLLLARSIVLFERDSRRNGEDAFGPYWGSNNSGAAYATVPSRRLSENSKNPSLLSSTALPKSQRAMDPSGSAERSRRFSGF